MFSCILNHHCRSFISAHAEMFNDKTVLVGCSGNFTFEQLITKHAKPRKIISNDVSLYSRMIGAWLSGQVLDLGIQDQDFLWLEKYIKDPVSKAATAVLLMRSVKFAAQKTDYARNIWAHFKSHWGDYHAETIKRLDATKATVGAIDFWAGDVQSFFESHRGQDLVRVVYMPTFAKGDATVFRAMDKVLCANPPISFDRLNDEKKRHVYQAMANGEFLVCDDQEVDGLPLVFKGMGHGVQRPTYIMSDFPTPHTGYPKASKLMLLLATTKEVQRTVEEALWAKMKTLTTAAFTKRPVSMKYRGIFNLDSRNEEKGVLNYSAPAGTRTIKGALKEWLKHYGQR